VKGEKIEDQKIIQSLINQDQVNLKNMVRSILQK